jgi:DNA invertase Pin-like site-specific DNA recombinase
MPIVRICAIRLNMDTMETQATQYRKVKRTQRSADHENISTPAPGQRIGYRRVSSLDQSTARQLDGIRLNKCFTDQASGKDTNRPQLNAALDYCREGDTLVVHSMDRLARSLVDLRQLVKELTARGVAVEFIKENLRFVGEDAPIAVLLLSLLGAVAEFERALILERQREGIAIAKAAGKYKGRRRALSASQQDELRRRCALGERKMVLAQQFGISRETLYCYLRTS